ncbi:ester cyclase [Chitinophaga sp. Mgbs1]|uniref:Ester cyclase n=1 Tax=Chitinophaga solisilvae TaxID=1233460 RepID=A0A433WN62_9BACT|nr:ester cyclase [Chitinophaga solisilvae]
MQTVQELNKSVVRRFNEAFIINGDLQAFEEIVAPDFINATAPPGWPADKESTRDFILLGLRKAFADLTLEIFDMVAEDDKVFTHKAFTGIHVEELLGVAPTGKKTTLRIMDLIELKDGQYVKHWSVRELKTTV